MQMQLLSQGGNLPRNLSSSLDSSIEAGGNDVKALKERNRKLQEENQQLAQELRDAVDQNAEMCERILNVETNRDQLKARLEDLKTKTGWAN